MGACTRGGAGGAGGSQGWGRPGAKAARDQGREGVQRSGPAPPLTRFSSSSFSSSGARDGVATTSHYLFQLSSDTVAAPLVCPTGPAPPRPLRHPIGQRRRHFSVAVELALLLLVESYSAPPLPPPVSAPTKPRHARGALLRGQLLPLAPAAVLPSLPWRCIPTYNPKSAPSLAKAP